MPHFGDFVYATCSDLLPIRLPETGVRGRLREQRPQEARPRGEHEQENAEGLERDPASALDHGRTLTQAPKESAAGPDRHDGHPHHENEHRQSEDEEAGEGLEQATRRKGDDEDRGQERRCAPDASERVGEAIDEEAETRFAWPVPRLDSLKDTIEETFVTWTAPRATSAIPTTDRRASVTPEGFGTSRSRDWAIPRPAVPRTPPRRTLKEFTPAPEANPSATARERSWLRPR